jgi:hypothetical protein
MISREKRGKTSERQTLSTDKRLMGEYRPEWRAK